MKGYVLLSVVKTMGKYLSGEYREKIIIVLNRLLQIHLKLLQQQSFKKQ